MLEMPLDGEKQTAPTSMTFTEEQEAEAWAQAQAALGQGG